MNNVMHDDYLSLLARFKCFIFYCVDPGAYACFVQLRNEIFALGNKTVHFYFDGWASSHTKLPSQCVSELKHDLEKSKDTLFILGSQTDFDATYQWISYSQKKSIPSLFIFDHWKNYAEHFTANNKCAPIFTNYLFVPDLHARKILEEVVPGLNAIHEKIYITGHFGLKSNLAQIQNYPSTLINRKKQAFCPHSQKIIVFFLDPASENNSLYPGYSPQSTLEFLSTYVATYYSDAHIIIKPHPRQDKQYIQTLLKNTWIEISYNVYEGDELPLLIAIADEVWGMTTMCLVLACSVGKTIKSFQINRNEQGRKQSNLHIEPYTITS